MPGIDPVSSILGAGVGLIGGIGGLFGAGSANRKLEQLISKDPTYKANPIAAQRMGLAQTLLNARSPGAAYAQQNIYGNQANQQANVERNATDASQALALGAVSQGQTNKAFGDLNNQEAEDYQRRYGNLVGAQQGQIQEGDKVYQDQIRRFNDLAQIRGMQSQNTQNAWGSLSNLGFGALNFGLAGGFRGLGGGNSNSGSPMSQPLISQPNPYGTGGPQTF